MKIAGETRVLWLAEVKALVVRVGDAEKALDSLISATREVVSTVRVLAEFVREINDQMSLLEDRLDKIDGLIANPDDKPDCNCGWGGQHDPDNLNCQANQ